MAAQDTAAILDELLALEQVSLVPRLMESGVFVSHLSASDLVRVQQMARASEEHSAALTTAIFDLNGVPAPRLADMSSADMHYDDLGHCLPRLLADREALVKRYESAAERVGSEPRATQLVQRILSHHREEVTVLRHLSQDAPTSTE